ncbi:MAG: cytoplasmic protein [Candidatus Buchananbacteria bacterium]|nr:cytoplasmic protein [Candidatus Buchananbacteria bacterium]
MPYGNGTGPLGAGPGTGRGRGPCGAGLRRGWRSAGRRRFLRNWQPTAEDLTAEEKLLKEELDAIAQEKKALKE